MLEQISIPPDDDEPNPMYTPAAVGTVVFVVVPEHDMAPHVILLLLELCYSMLEMPRHFH